MWLKTLVMLFFIVPCIACAGDDYAVFHEQVENLMEDSGIPGVAIGLIKDNRLVMAKGYGVRNVHTKAPVTYQTLFHIGSTQKAMNSLLVAAFVDEGIMKWDAPVRDYDEGFTLSNDDYTEQLTIRHLLTMTSGIDDSIDALFHEQTDSIDKLFDLIEVQSLTAVPGKDYSYSNVALSASGYLAIMAKSQHYDDDLFKGYVHYMTQYLLKPIGMKQSTFSRKKAIATGHYATSYTLEDNELVVPETEDVEGDPLVPSGGLKSSVSDMTRYLLTELREGVTPEGVNIANPQTVKERWKPYKNDYGMGWEYDTQEGVDYYSHDGSYDHFTSKIGIIPSKNAGYVVLTNCDFTGDFFENLTPVITSLLMQ